MTVRTRREPLRSHRQIVALKPQDTAYRRRCGENLYIVVQPSGSRYFILRLQRDGRSTDRGLGSFDVVPLSEARQRAHEIMRAVRRGELLRPPKKAKIPTFRQAAARVAAAATWRGTRTADGRRAALARYCGGIMDLPVDQITRADVLAILTPMWRAKPKMATQVRGWVRAALAWAQAHEFVSSNAAGEAINAALPTNARAVARHYAAVPHADAAAALAAVERGAAGAPVRAALRFIALAACRTGEARLATWNEIDFTARVWTIPAARTKAGRPHRVPLSDTALAVLERMRPFEGPGGVIFPSRRGRALSPPTLLAAWRASGAAGTLHGLRSAFRDWAADAGHPRDVAEASLAHVVGGTEGAYLRSDLLERRRALMADWADYVVPDMKQSGTT